MFVARTRIARALAGVGLVVCLTAALCGALPSLHASDRLPPTPTELRAMWVLRTSLVSPESIATLVRSARSHGFNTLFVQVRGRGDAYYAGSLEPRASELGRQPEDFDPLAEVLRSAHESGLRVHAWVNVNLISSAVELPRAREHLVYRHPEWLMVPRDLAQELSRVDPMSPGYLGKIARWSRAESNEIEGLYSSPVAPAAVDHLSAIVRDLSRRYAVDGVHFDYTRYPTDRFDYSRSTIQAFRAWIEPRLPLAVKRHLAAQEENDIFAFPDALQDDWRTFRIARLTALVGRLREAVKQERPDALVSVAVAPDIREAFEHRLQEWPRWLENGIVDAVAPMAYTTEPARFADQIAAARAVGGGRQVWAGIGAYRLSPSQTIENIATARRLGAGGIILFSYDSLTGSSQTVRDYLELVARGAFGQAEIASGSR